MNDVLLVLDVGVCAGLIAAPSVLSMAIAWRCIDLPDLGIEAAFPLGAAVAALVLKAGASPTVALLAASASGVVPGLLTGGFHAYLRLPKLLAGVLVATLFYSVNLRLMGGANLSLLGTPSLLDSASALDAAGGAQGSLHVGRFLILAAILSVLGATAWAALRTRPGLRLQAVGANPGFAVDLGIPARAYVVTGMAMTNALAAMSGALLAMHQGFADVGMGLGVLVMTVASLAIGERLLAPWTGRSRQLRLVLAAIVGAVVYHCLVVVALRMGLPAPDLKMATAGLVIVFMYAQFRQPAGAGPSRAY